MIMFYFFAGLICIATIVLATRPLLTGRAQDVLAQEDVNIQFLRDRLNELEDQKMSGRLSDEEYTALKHDLETTLALEIKSQTDDTERLTDRQLDNRAPARAVALTITVFIPIFAALTYAWVGTPSALTPQANVAVDMTSIETLDPAELEQLIAQAETHLADNPDDQQGWALLARAYMGLGRFTDAERAYAALLAQSPPSASLLVAMADASALAQGGGLDGKPIGYLREALALDPQLPQALWLAGLHSVQTGDNTSAKDYWLRLLPLLAAAPERQADLRAIIAELDSNAADAVSAVAASEDDIHIAVSVEIAEQLSTSLNDTDTLFIIVREHNGPRIPLAVKRVPALPLPRDIIVTKQDAMQKTISLVGKVLSVSARVSQSGNAMPQAGDLLASPKTVSTEAISTSEINEASGAPTRRVTLVLDQLHEQVQGTAP